MALRLIIENLDGVTTMVPLTEVAVTIGRTADNTIQLSEQNVSRRHAQMLGSTEGWRIEDRASYNGVLVNGISILEPTPLREGDLIQIGDYHLVLTDSTDKQTLDLQRPRRVASAREEPVLASSSSDLPQLTPSEIAVLTGEARTVEQVERERKFPWIGIAIAVGCVAVMVVAALQWTGDDDSPVTRQAPTAKQPPARVDTKAKAKPAAKAVFPSAAEEEEEFPLAELLPPGSTDEDEHERADGSSGERTKRSSSNRRRSRSSRSRSETPVQDAKIALRRARSAASAGKPGRAYKLAKAAYELNPTDDALYVMGKAACQLRQSSKARAALRKIGDGRKSELVSACGRLGVEL